MQLLADLKTIKGLLEFVGDLLKTFQPMLASEKISNLVFVGEQKIPTVTSVVLPFPLKMRLYLQSSLYLHSH